MELNSKIKLMNNSNGNRIRDHSWPNIEIENCINELNKSPILSIENNSEITPIQSFTTFQNKNFLNGGESKSQIEKVYERDRNIRRSLLSKEKRKKEGKSSHSVRFAFADSEKAFLPKIYTSFKDRDESYADLIGLTSNFSLLLDKNIGKSSSNRTSSKNLNIKKNEITFIEYDKLEEELKTKELKKQKIRENKEKLRELQNFDAHLASKNKAYLDKFKSKNSDNLDLEANIKEKKLVKSRAVTNIIKGDSMSTINKRVALEFSDNFSSIDPHSERKRYLDYRASIAGNPGINNSAASARAMSKKKLMQNKSFIQKNILKANCKNEEDPDLFFIKRIFYNPPSFTKVQDNNLKIPGEKSKFSSSGLSRPNTKNINSSMRMLAKENQRGIMNVNKFEPKSKYFSKSYPERLEEESELENKRKETVLSFKEKAAIDNNKMRPPQIIKRSNITQKNKNYRSNSNQRNYLKENKILNNNNTIQKIFEKLPSLTLSLGESVASQSQRQNPFMVKNEIKPETSSRRIKNPWMRGFLERYEKENSEAVSCANNLAKSRQKFSRPKTMSRSRRLSKSQARRTSINENDKYHPSDFDGTETLYSNITETERRLEKIGILNDPENLKNNNNNSPDTERQPDKISKISDKLLSLELLKFATAAKKNPPKKINTNNNNKNLSGRKIKPRKRIALNNK